MKACGLLAMMLSEFVVSLSASRGVRSLHRLRNGATVLTEVRGVSTQVLVEGAKGGWVMLVLKAWSRMAARERVASLKG